MVSGKLFRKDLYYRLNVVPIYVPPLRERRDEILPLIFHYLEKFNKTYHKNKAFSPEVLEACVDTIFQEIFASWVTSSKG